MLTMAGNRGPMLVMAPGFQQANTTPPKLSPEEEARRKQLMQQIRTHDAHSMKKCQTNDRSLPMASGKISTPGGWVDKPMQAVPLGGLSGGRGGAARGGVAARGPPGLGDLFAGGRMPNPGALRGAPRGRGGGRAALPMKH